MTASGSGAFARLHPNVQYLVASTLGWSSLRPVQELTIPPILDGATTVVVAPTAGGKTEAAMLPLLSRIVAEHFLPTSVAYVAPLRALLNDLGDRLTPLAQALGLRIEVWHGDVSQSARKKIVADPPDLLLTTPESLEVLLSLGGPVRRSLLLGLRAIVVDEIHAFYGVERGVHLLALIERLAASAEHDVQRIGLSATLGNPEQLAAWFRGTSGREIRLVDAPAAHRRRERFEVRSYAGLADIARDLAATATRKTVVFARTRSDVEELAHLLYEHGVAAWPHHSALGRETRETAEREFRAASRGYLVATSTLELGIDIGDLDDVVQIDAPTTVASLLQRLGRTGRRSGADARMTFMAAKAEQTLLAVALLTLRAAGWVEPLVPIGRPFAVLVQQIFAIVLQYEGVTRSRLIECLAVNAAFAEISAVEIGLCIDELVQRDLLAEADEVLMIGHAGERRFGRRAFSGLASVFSSPDSVSVVADGRDVGMLDRWFVEEMRARERHAFLLNGRAWHVVGWPDDGPVLTVTPARSAKSPLYLGSGLVLSYPVMQAVRRVLAARSIETLRLPADCDIDAAARALINRAWEAAEPQALELPGTSVITDAGGSTWYTYAGIRANRALADAFRQADEQTVVATNTSVRFSGRFDVARFQLARLALTDKDKLSGLLAALKQPGKSDSGKFLTLLPPEIQAACVRAERFDAEGASAILGEPVRHVGHC